MMNAFMKSDIYKDLKAAICGHLKQVTRADRTQIKINMGEASTVMEAIFG
jgi:hypothetical protein